MAKKTKTQEVVAFTPDELERIKVDDTKKVNLDDINESLIDDELEKMSIKDLEYRLEFEESDPKIIKKIKKILARR